MKDNQELQKMKKVELIEYIQELQKSNNRNAGRKEKFTEEHIEQIVEARKEGKSLRTIAKELECSVGLVHKLIKK